MGVLKSNEDFRANLVLLEDGINQYHAGIREYFRMVAVYLWTLLCDTAKDKRLILRIYPDFKLHPLAGGISDGTEKPAIQSIHDILGPTGVLNPVLITRDNVKIAFLEKRQPIKIQKWLDQPFLSQDVTIQKFIQSVRHKLGAHPDPQYDELLLLLKDRSLLERRTHEIITILLGEYVLKQIKIMQIGN
jgi:hypothetical protein